MSTIELLYSLSVILALSAAVPQVKKLIKLKSSSEFSLTTWVAWLGTQIIAFVYALSVDAKAYMAASAAWVVFYLIIVMLIIKYRPRIEKEPLLLEAGDAGVADESSKRYVLNGKPIREPV
jgi:hypothetical protein